MIPLFEYNSAEAARAGFYANIAAGNCIALTWPIQREDGVDEGKPLLGLFVQNSDHAVLVCAITDRVDEAKVQIDGLSAELPNSPESALGTLEACCEVLQIEPITLDSLLPLQPTPISKPWGTEYWYTGIEDRGFSTIAGTPLHWLLSIFAGTLGLTDTPQVLLKELVPHADVDLGNLYLESHRNKSEVYIVTAVDLGPWPDGCGKLLAGFDPAQKAKFESDTAFLSACQNAIIDYQQHRRQIDAALDKERHNAGYADGAVVKPATTRRWLDKLPETLINAEQEAFNVVRTFFRAHSVRVGDVITLEPGLIHSLQHGVSVIEFQTPHYERMIVAFQQKVLTQEHWDTEQAFSYADSNVMPTLTHLKSTSGPHLLGAFPGFTLVNLHLQPGEQCYVRDSGHIGNGALILISLGNGCTINGNEAPFKEPHLLAAGVSAFASNRTSTALQLLVACCDPV